MQCCRFLHKRYESLLQNPSRTIQVRAKKKPQSRFFIGQPSNGNASSQLPANNQGCKLRDAVTPTTSAAIDLNEASLPVTTDNFLNKKTNYMVSTYNECCHGRLGRIWTITSSLRSLTSSGRVQWKVIRWISSSQFVEVLAMDCQTWWRRRSHGKIR